MCMFITIISRVSASELDTLSESDVVAGRSKLAQESLAASSSFVNLVPIASAPACKTPVKRSDRDPITSTAWMNQGRDALRRRPPWAHHS
jgi:hypothetical protein